MGYMHCIPVVAGSYDEDSVLNGGGEHQPTPVTASSVLLHCLDTFVGDDEGALSLPATAQVALDFSKSVPPGTDLETRNEGLFEALDQDVCISNDAYELAAEVAFASTAGRLKYNPLFASGYYRWQTPDAEEAIELASEYGFSIEKWDWVQDKAASEVVLSLFRTAIINGRSSTGEMSPYFTFIFGDISQPVVYGGARPPQAIPRIAGADTVPSLTNRVVMADAMTDLPHLGHEGIGRELLLWATFHYGKSVMAGAIAGNAFLAIAAKLGYGGAVMAVLRHEA